VFDIKRWFAARQRRRPDDDVGWAAVALDEGRPEEALAALDEALAGDLTPERRAFGLNKRGVALIALGRRDDARAAFTEALAAVERCAPPLVNLGNLLLEDGDVEGAIESYRAAIRADESYPMAYLNLGVALKRAGRRAEAVRSLRTGHRLEMRRPP
jgi:tetratricopeptide (TPR) repeat protein